MRHITQKKNKNMSINKAILVGNMGKDVELRYTQSGIAVATFSLATKEVYKDRDGQRQEKTEIY